MTVARSKKFASVKKLVKKLKEENWKKIEKELLEKRLEWFRKNIKHLSLKGDDLEKAYQLILLKIGIKPEEAPIIKKTKRKLVFHSKIFCPALEACKILGLDTRKVCKRIFEKPTEELIKEINPKLSSQETTRKLGLMQIIAKK